MDFFKLAVFSFVLLIYGIGWDMWATKHGRKDKLWIWCFNPKTITGIYLDRHPLEEYIFGIFHLFWVILLWEVLSRAISNNDLLTLFIVVLLGIWQIGVSINFYNSQKKKA
ncbi:MAG: lycopene cyclase domain-containing protein [Patescibacteria group bacterium]